MPQMIPAVHAVLAVAVGLTIGGYLHEFSHRFVGWLGNTDASIEWVFFIPDGVDHGRIETMDSSLIRLSGVAVFVWIPPGILAATSLLLAVTPATLFITAVPIGVQAIATESDAIAVRDPEAFRQMWMDDEHPRNPLYLPNWMIPDRLPRF